MVKATVTKVQRLWVIWGQCCPRVAATPSLPNGPITQLSPYFTRKHGTSIYVDNCNYIATRSVSMATEGGTNALGKIGKDFLFRDNFWSWASWSSHLAHVALLRWGGRLSCWTGCSRRPRPPPSTTLVYPSPPTSATRPGPARSPPASPRRPPDCYYKIGEVAVSGKGRRSNSWFSEIFPTSKRDSACIFYKCGILGRIHSSIQRWMAHHLLK